MNEYRDSSGKRLVDYPRPSVTVDTATLTVRDDQLMVALIATAANKGSELGKFQLPGTFLWEGETLAGAVHRSLIDKVDGADWVPEQLRVFDDPNRDPRGWVLTVAHVLVAPTAAFGKGVQFVPVTQAIGLSYDHDQILRLAVDRLRQQYRERPDPSKLLGDKFTLNELQQLHAAIDPALPKRDTFRRGMLEHLVAVKGVRKGVVGKPAQLYRRKKSDVSVTAKD
ncbi:MAG: NUDIX hydrolase [Microbacteriaceae bacterium]